MTPALCPISLKDAQGFVKSLHRHHGVPVGHKFSIGARAHGILIGVVVVGRPVARGADDGLTAEVTRLCTDGTPNACSMLYGAAIRACKAMGYHRVITYTLATENGASLRASGFRQTGKVRGRSWSCQSRPREDKAEVQDKHRWEWP